MTTTQRYESLLHEIARREERVLAYLNQPRFRALLAPDDIREGSLAYLNRPAKRLRPAVLLLSCAAVGGSEESALPAAAAVELAHTWTLTHDDIIDNDSLRRGQPTVHVLLGERAPSGARELTASDRHRYGTRTAILVGDAQHAWSIVALLDAAEPPYRVDARVVLSIARILESETIQLLIKGETLDIQYEDVDRRAISEAEVVEMLRLKTGVLYEFAAMAGAMIGLQTPDRSAAPVKALSEFAGCCGIAFQLQDDVLGITGDERRLGKPVGSDIREGKCTTIVLHALGHASVAERELLADVLGNERASDAEIGRVRDLMVSLGSIQHTTDLARRYLLKGLRHLDELPPSVHRQLLGDWAGYLLDRDL